jgi:uncharacterized damage-inducible protein DinB
VTTYPPFPAGTTNELELLLRWLAFLRGAVMRKASGITDEQARWRPEGRLLPLAGIVNHLTNVEWRWIDGEMLGRPTGKSEEEYFPPGLPIATALRAYQRRAEETDAAVRAMGDLRTPCGYGEQTDLRFVLIHLINETARHAGHADAVRELLDGTTGE